MLVVLAQLEVLEHHYLLVVIGGVADALAVQLVHHTVKDALQDLGGLLGLNEFSHSWKWLERLYEKLELHLLAVGGRGGGGVEVVLSARTAGN